MKRPTKEQTEKGGREEALLSCEDQETERVREVEREREGAGERRDSGRGETRGVRDVERGQAEWSDRDQTLSPRRSTAQACDG